MSKVVIIGGGPCGATAAIVAARAGHEVVLLESRAEVGGMAGHERFGDNIYDFGTHVFHTDRPHIMELAREFGGNDLREYPRAGKLHIKFQGKYFRYPLRGFDLLANLPFSTVLHAGLSFGYSFLFRDLLGPVSQNTEQYLIAKFGSVLYRLFFEEYSRKAWGIPCSELDVSFGEQRIPRSDIFGLLKSILVKLGLSRLVDKHPLSEGVIGNVFYTPRGVSLIYKRMAQEVESLGGTVVCGARLTRLCGSKRGVSRAICATSGGHIEVDGDSFISTIPLPVLATAMEDGFAGDAVQAAQGLEYRAISVVGLLINKSQVREPYLTYYPAAVFNRLSEPKNHGLPVCPEDHTVLLAERVCGTEDAAFRGDEPFVDAVVDGLVAEGLIDRAEVVERHHLAWRYAYPIYRIGYADRVDAFAKMVSGLGNLLLAGRHGEFKYVNMHVAMDMGRRAVEQLAEGAARRS